MKNEELLKAIQNADRSFFEKAEQRMHHREEHTMKRIVMRKIMTGAAAAAVLAVTVTGGIYLANRNPSNLTEPSNSLAATAPIEEQGSGRITEPAVLANTAVTTAAAPAQENFLKGHGAFRFGPQSSIMCDDDYWYFNDMAYCIRRSDDTYLRREDNNARCYNLTMEGYYKNDPMKGGIYHLVNYRQKQYLYTVADDGTETQLPLDNVFECFRKPDAPDDLCNKAGIIYHVMHLKDGKYYMTGYFYDPDKPQSEDFKYFWTIYDTETQTGSGQLMKDTERTFYDGDTGVYAWLLNHPEEQFSNSSNPYGQNRKLYHCLADGTNEVVFEGKIYGNGWYVYNNCVYYTDYNNGDYCRYDISTKQTTVLVKGAYWGDLYHAGDMFCTVKNQKFYYGAPDTTKPDEWDIPIMEGTEYIEDTLYVEAVCDGTVIFRNVASENTRTNPTSTEVIRVPEYWIVYQPETGKVQYINNEAADAHQTTTAPTTTAAAETTETTAAAVQAGENCLGGHGTLKGSPNSRVLEDDENWYTSLAYCAKKSDAKYLPSGNVSVRVPSQDYLDYLDYCTQDQFSGEIYHIYARNDKGIYLVNDDGTERFLISGLYDSFRKPEMPDKKNIDPSIFEVCRLTESKFFISGRFIDDTSADDAAPSEYFSSDFWAIFDSGTQECRGELLRSMESDLPHVVQTLPSRVYSDGNTGAYIDDLTPDSVKRIVHCKADGNAEVILNADIKHECWFVSGNCIYYVSADANGDYCKYDMNTKQTTVLVKNAVWDNLVFANGNVYAAKGGTLIYGDPEMAAPHEWKIEYPAQMDVISESCMVEAVFDNTVILYNADLRNYGGTESADELSDLFARHDYKILYHTDSGKVQFIYKPEAYTPPAE